MMNRKSARYMELEHLITGFNWYVLGFGKVTICEINTVSGRKVRGYAVKNPKDKHDVKLGYEIAQGRALKRLQKFAKHIESSKPLLKKKIFTGSLALQEFKNTVLRVKPGVEDYPEATEEDRNKYRVE